MNVGLMFSFRNPPQWKKPWADVYESPDRCPDELLLFFHHVPYGHVLKSGRTVSLAELR